MNGEANKVTLLLRKETDDLVSVLASVTRTTDMNPVITTVTWLHNELIEVGVLDNLVEPVAEDVLVRVGFVVCPHD